MPQQTKYEQAIQSRTKVRFLIGVIARLKIYFRQNYINWVARRNGATIGENVTIPYKLAKIANANLRVGNHCSIQTHLIDLRSIVNIGNYVIIGSGVEILTCSHNLDSEDWEMKSYGIDIADYCWLATRSFILPSCRRIEYGAVCAAGAVVVKNVDSMSIVSGNPAVSIKQRQTIHSSLCVEALLGNDLMTYCEVYQCRKQG